MDGTLTDLQTQLNQPLHEATRVAAAVDRVNGTVMGVPQ